MGILKREILTISNFSVGDLVIKEPMFMFMETKFYYKPALSGSRWYRILFREPEELQEFLEFETAMETMAYLRGKNLLKTTRVSFKIKKMEERN